MRRFPFELKLYVASTSVQSARAVQTIQRICVQHLEHRYSLEIIDIGLTPERAVEDQILNVPTLVRAINGGKKKLIGDVSNEQNVLWFLEIDTNKK